MREELQAWISFTYGGRTMTATTLATENFSSRARVVGHVDLDHRNGSQVPAAQQQGGDFLAEQAASPCTGEQLQHDLDRVLAEIRELQAENRWDDILALFHPVETRLPELVDSGMADELRLKIGFVLCRAKRHQEAISCLSTVTKEAPDNALAHYSLAYTALDALFEARTSRSPLPGQEKKALLGTAHDHFARACALRPDSVTFFYRHGVLCKEIERKYRRAIPLFEQAVVNWERLDAEDRKKQHQQYPKYIKAMYHLASCLLQEGRVARSLELVEKVVELDRDRDHLQPVFKHFAMAKVLYRLGRPQEALEHLEVAAHRASKGQQPDFVYELAARCALALGQQERAARYINRVPASRRRPYVRWTEADVLLAAGRRNEALQVLAASAEHDRRSRHKALIRMARIHVADGQSEEALRLSREAAEFCRLTFGSPSHEALYWQAAALYLLNRFGEALAIVKELEEHRFRYPNFRRLAELVRKADAGTGREGRIIALVQ